MRVAIVYPFFAHYRSSIIELLSRDQDLDYHFIGGTERNNSYSSLKLHEFSNKSKFFKVKNSWILRHFLWQKGLLKLIKQGNYDAVVLFADWKYITTWLIIPYLYKKNIPFLFWSHGLLDNKASLNNKMKMFFLMLFKYGGFVYDHRAKDIMVSKGYKYPLSVIYNSLDYVKQSEILNSLDSSSFSSNAHVKSPYVIFTGRVIRQRQLELLFDSIAILANKNIIVNALIIGNGPYLEVLKKYTKNIGIAEQVVFYGSCYNELQLASFFSESIACVFPGPIGLTAIHSLTYGTPVITNDNLYSQKPEIEAVREGVTGAFYREGCATSLAEKIEHFRNMTLDERSRYKENCFMEIREKFNASNQYRIINKTLAEILDTVEVR